jgi:methylmalonyl-CoA mutase N-terminal domain/subunit
VLEALTDKIEAEAEAYIAKIDALGGMVPAIAKGYPQLEIAEAAYREQKAFDAREKVIVGVNGYQTPEERPIDTLHIPMEVEDRQVDRVRRFKKNRDAAGAREALAEVRAAAESGDNLMPPLVRAVKKGCSVGEISDVYRAVFGEYRDPAHV